MSASNRVNGSSNSNHNAVGIDDNKGPPSPAPNLPTTTTTSSSSLPLPSEMYISVRRDFAVLIGRQLNALSPVTTSLLDTIFWGSPIKSLAHIAFFTLGAYYQLCGIRCVVVLFWVHVFLVAVWNKVSEGAASVLPGASSSSTSLPPRGSISATSNAPRMSPAEIHQCLRAYKLLTINLGRLIRRYPALFSRTSTFWMGITVSLLFFDLVICEVMWGTSLFFIIDTLLAPIAACTIIVCYGVTDPRYTLTYNVRHSHSMPPRTEVPSSPATATFPDFGAVTATTSTSRQPGGAFDGGLRNSVYSIEEEAVTVTSPNVPSSSLAFRSATTTATGDGGANKAITPIAYDTSLTVMRPFIPKPTPGGSWDTTKEEGGTSFEPHSTVPAHVHKIFNILMRGPEWQIWKNFPNTKDYRKFCPLPIEPTKGSTKITPRCDPTASLPESYKALLDAVFEYNEATMDDNSKKAEYAQLQQLRAKANRKEESTEPEMLASGHVVPWTVVKCSYNCLRIRCPSLPSQPTSTSSKSIQRRSLERGISLPEGTTDKSVYRDRRLFHHVVDWLDDDDGAIDSNQLNVYQYDKLLGDYRRLKYHKFTEPLVGEHGGENSEEEKEGEKQQHQRWVSMRVVHYLYKQLVFAIAPRDASVFTTCTQLSPTEAAHYGVFGDHTNTFFPDRVLSNKELLTLQTPTHEGGPSLKAAPQGTMYHVCSTETDAPLAPGHVRTNIHRQAIIVVAPPLRRHVVIAQYCAQEGLAIPPAIQTDMLRGTSSTTFTPNLDDDTDGEDQVVLVITMICGEPGGRIPAAVAEIARGEQVRIVTTIKDKLHLALQQAF